MNEKEKTKRKIIEITTELLKEYHGDTKKLTTRLIAEKAQIGLGTINYFFGSKEKLIAECVQQIINQVLIGFVPEITNITTDDGLTDKERLTVWADQTFDFLFENQTIAEIAILNDMHKYIINSNTVYTQQGFAYAIRESIDDKAKKALIFSLVSSMQAAFLARDIAQALLGYNLYSKSERKAFINNIISLLFIGIENTENKENEA